MKKEFNSHKGYHNKVNDKDLSKPIPKRIKKLTDKEFETLANEKDKNK